MGQYSLIGVESTFASNYKPGVMSNRAQEYRRRANECLAVARTVSNLQGRASLEAIAQMWFRLADKHDPPAARTPAAEGADYARQLIQQQQPQPKKPGDKD